MDGLSSAISISQAANAMGITQDEVCQMMRQGQLSSRMINGNRVLSQGTILEYQVRKQLHHRKHG